MLYGFIDGHALISYSCIIMFPTYYCIAGKFGKELILAVRQI